MGPTERVAAKQERLVPAPIGGLAVLVLVLGAALLLREVSDLVVQLLFGGFFALIAWPMMGALRRANVPSSVALGLTALVMLIIVLVAGALIAISVVELVTLIPTYEDQLLAVIDSLRTFLAEYGIRTDREALLAMVSPEQVTTLAQAVASSVSSAGVAVGVSAMTMVFALAGASTVQAQAERILGADHPTVAGVMRFAAEARRYLLVRAELGLFAAVLSFVLLLVLGVPLAALWASLVFAASFIPNIGTLLALIPPTILALLDIGLLGAVAVVVGYSVINTIQDNLLQPIVVGTELNLTPLIGFVGVIAWAWILGPAGAILAVPLTLGLAQLLEAFPSTRALAALMRNRDQAGAAPAKA